MLDLLIHHAETPQGVFDLGIAEGIIVECAPSIAGSARETMNATGLLVWPGIIDAHVHFNEPGRAEWEGLRTGPQAFAAGGGTTFFDMPLNSTPPTANVRTLGEKRRAAEAKSVLDFGLWGALIPGNHDDMEPMAAAGVIGFKAFLSDSGMPEFPHVSADVLKKGMKRAAAVGRVVGLHAEDNELTRQLTAAARAAGSKSVRAYLDSRPVEAELQAIAMATELAGETGCALHIVHVSSPEGLHLVRTAQAAGVDVTAETCPHYLLLNDLDVERIGAMAKCAPPIRDEVRRQQLWQALASGEVQTLGSDHSPSPPDLKKSADFFDVWGGIAGCQHGFCMTLAEGLLDHALPPALLSNLLSKNVATRFGIAHRKGSIAPGKDADLTIMKLESGTEIRPENLLTRHRISAYTGRSNQCRIVRTLCRGRTVWPIPKNKSAAGGQWIKPA